MSWGGVLLPRRRCEGALCCRCVVTHQAAVAGNIGLVFKFNYERLTLLHTLAKLEMIMFMKARNTSVAKHSDKLEPAKTKNKQEQTQAPSGSPRRSGCFAYGLHP